MKSESSHVRLTEWKDKTDLTIQWLKSTFHNQTSEYTYIRQLEFEILLLQIQVRELLDGVESSLNGKLSLNLIPPEVLMRILKNVTFFLPDGYNLFAGLQINDTYFYYEYSKVTVVASHHNLRLIISIPLKTFDRDYTLYRLITLPFKIAELNKYVQLVTEYPYLILDDSKQRFLRWTEADLAQCGGKNFAICAADSAVLMLSSTILTCESSMFFFFQKYEARILCGRRAMPSHFSPILIRNQRDWIYSLGDQQQHVNFKCLVNNTWVTSSLILQGNGVLHNASVCYIVGREFQLYPRYKATQTWRFITTQIRYFNTSIH
jgi:hypothetical protein